MSDINATLAERGSRYGKFTGHAEITQHLKNYYRDQLAQRGTVMSNDMHEAMDMIMHKIGRIVNGDPYYADSWVDIAGYAQLVSTRLSSGKEV